MPETQLRPWETVGVETILDLPPWLSVKRDSVRLPSGRVIDDYYRVETPDYALICARDAEGRVLFERHYKQCLERFILTLPAGGIDGGETPLQGARRELLEETGYQAASWRAGGAFTVDGTRGICRAHFFFADSLVQAAPPHLDEMEEFELVFLERREIAQAVADGQICLLPDIALLALGHGTLLDP